MHKKKQVSSLKQT